jgi:hypothetical protein
MSLFSQEQRVMNIMLDEEDFKCLIRGGVLTVNSYLKLALEDFGFYNMDNAMRSVRAGNDIGKPRDREND